ncbi:PIN domain-like protein [Multifurca ochricompacta]|uniref:PIN domain-like protein n=1 Tax=Multifurca ochricompacta TaxID=376703 RepID=A0AAD4M2Y8_9AGAM|nr:PIN domain-like protein [Multifurca ochricompacta]
MGIQGLLPFLKSIQHQRHLSELSNQTLAVDGYVWLHRGIYTCATELATGRKTSKYVHYAMQRVRLLRHYGIHPYIVFDGGHLPAKLVTEEDRKRRRSENLARANALAAEGKHAQAREYYSKCVDVTPEMAFQLIKALRAEDVPYIVAPYEADAQLAYLERVGIVDGIITEDSDLLVFGCKKVYFKLNDVEGTVTSISRADFGKVADCSLLGWTDAQFRAMAILSGCDYLPSIPGVGLKTAWTLLRKYRTPENVIRSLRLEGKKRVPQGYLEAFMITERVFLYQRVYDPLEEKLVNLTQVPFDEILSPAHEAFIGRDIAPTMAKLAAKGEVDPNTHLPMKDINPSFSPLAIKPLPFQLHDLNTSKLKGKKVETPKGASILNFFAPKTIDPAFKTPKSAVCHIVAGRASGKRRLVGLIDDDVGIKRKRLPEYDRGENIASPVTSYFFGDNGMAGSSRLGPTPKGEGELDTEEVVLVGDCSDGEEVEGIDTSDQVAQEDGYLSPASSLKRLSTPDLSSPPRPLERSRVFCRDSSTQDFAVDTLSSPETGKVVRGRGKGRPRSKSLSNGRDNMPGHILVPDTPRRSERVYLTDGQDGDKLRGLNLFEDEDMVEIDDFTMAPSSFGGSTQSSSGLDTPASQEIVGVGTHDGGLDLDDEIEFIEMRQARQEAVSRGWWSKWANERYGYGGYGNGKKELSKPRVSDDGQVILIE